MSTSRTWQVRGNPTEAELAAVVTAISAAAAAAAAAPPSGAPPGDVGGWAAYWRGLRQPLPTGPGAWTASAWR